MREALAFFVLLILISLGWNQPFCGHLANLTGKPLPAKSRDSARRTVAGTIPPRTNPLDRQTSQASPSRDNSWMWGPTIMDKPSNQK
jgi:hypothetical protein